MPYPPLVTYATEAEYRAHYERLYCQGPVVTHDGISVRFRKEKFGHCFFESTHRNQTKDAFSRQRAERMDWIQAALQDAHADLLQGWDKARHRYDPTYRVALVQGNYAVVIQIANAKAANFVTAYVVDTPASLAKIKGSPKWR